MTKGKTLKLIHSSIARSRALGAFSRQVTFILNMQVSLRELREMYDEIPRGYLPKYKEKHSGHGKKRF